MITQNPDSWIKGYRAAKWEECPYPVDSLDALSWESGRIEALAAVERKEEANRLGRNILMTLYADCDGFHVEFQATRPQDQAALDRRLRKKNHHKQMTFLQWSKLHQPSAPINHV